MAQFHQVTTVSDQQFLCSAYTHDQAKTRPYTSASLARIVFKQKSTANVEANDNVCGTRAQLTQRDRATAACCACLRKVYCAVVRTALQTSRHSAALTACAALATTGQVSLSQYFRWKETLSGLYFSVISQLIECSATLPLEVFTQRNFVADFIRLTLTFTQKKTKKSPNCCWCQKTRVIAVSCDIKISFSFVTIHASDRRTELRQQYRAFQYMQSHGKNGLYNRSCLHAHKQHSLSVFHSKMSSFLGCHLCIYSIYFQRSDLS